MKPDGALPSRRLKVTGLLAILGATSGALLGAVFAVGVWLWAGGSDAAPFSLAILGEAGLAGGAIGFLLAPVTGWLLLRRVPLGIAIIYTALGTAVGFGIGITIPTGIGLSLPFVGFVVAALRLRRRYRPKAIGGGRSLADPALPA
jgi:hypothetical protein